LLEVNFTEAIEVLRKGEVLIYPTETLYGLGVDIHNPVAVQKIFQLKNRDISKPISLLVPTKKDIQKLVQQLSDKSLKLIDKFFPGPLTLVLPVAPTINPILHANSGWIGIRMSSHPLAQKLVETFGGPITTTSANPSGESSGRTLAQLKEYFHEQKGIAVLSGGDLSLSKGSTVVKVDGEQLKLLREGEIPFREIENV
jgi:L-threonylcarbamoyladenylate synthase